MDLDKSSFLRAPRLIYLQKTPDDPRAENYYILNYYVLPVAKFPNLIFTEPRIVENRTTEGCEVFHRQFSQIRNMTSLQKSNKSKASDARHAKEILYSGKCSHQGVRLSWTNKSCLNSYFCIIFDEKLDNRWITCTIMH